jgi:hypothetical protein
MMDIHNGCLEQIKKMFYFYIGAFSALCLITLIELLKTSFNESESTSKTVTILNYNISGQYFSFIYGILFFIFIVILRLQVSQLKESVIFSLKENARNKKDISVLIRFFPMLASPFRDSLVGPLIFWISILLGFLRLVPLILGHALGSVTEAENIFRGIAVFDGAVFIGGFYILYMLWKDIVNIRAMVRAKIRNN